MKKITKFITAFFIFVNMLVFAQNSGDLDTSFVPWAGINHEVYALALQSDGKILVGGTSNFNNIKRLNTDGSLDTSFHVTNSYVTSSTGSSASIKSIAIQPDGKILIGGHFERFGQFYNNPIDRFCLARLNADGSVDNSFQPPLLEYYVGGTSQPFSVYVSSIELQSDGKILIGGNFNRYGGGSSGCVARLHPNGYIDNTFDASTITMSGIVNVIKIQSDGNILMGGSFTNSDMSIGLWGPLVRVSTNGTKDSLFNATARSVVSSSDVRDILIQPDGKIIIGGSFGSMYSYYICKRLNSDGSNDATFSVGTTSDGSNVRSLALQPDGKIIVGGSFITYGSNSKKGITRLNTNGSVDNTFNSGTGIENNAQAGIIHLLKLQPNGKIIVGGRFTSYRDSTRNGIARINNCFIKHTTDNHTICTGESYKWINNVIYTNTNNTAMYTYSGGSSNCDSVIHLNLTVVQPITTIDTHTICEGESFTWIDGNTYTSTNNTATHTLQSTVTGCDSTVTLNLTVLQPITAIDYHTICPGGSFTWIDGNTYTSANNTVTHTLQSTVTGCDSIVTLNLSFLQLFGVDVQIICSGESFTWIDGNTYTSTNNIATYTLTNSLGCDSIVTLNLTVSPPLTDTVAQTICEGETYVFFGQNLTLEGAYTYTLQNQNNCDSVITLNLSINPLPIPTIMETNGRLVTQTWSSYQWLLNGIPIAGATSKNYIPTEDGDYTIQVTNNKNCIGTSSIFPFSYVGVSEIDKLPIKIHPNPATSSVTVSNVPNNSRIRILDNFGKLIYQTENSTNETTINTANFSNGVYIIQVTNKGSISNIKLIIGK